MADKNSPLKTYINYKDGWDGYDTVAPPKEFLEYCHSFWEKIKDFKSFYVVALCSGDDPWVMDFYFGSITRDNFFYMDLYSKPSEDGDEVPGSIGDYLWRISGVPDRSKHYFTQEEVIEDIIKFEQEYYERP